MSRSVSEKKKRELSHKKKKNGFEPSHEHLPCDESANSEEKASSRRSSQRKVGAHEGILGPQGDFMVTKPRNKRK